MKSEVSLLLPIHGDCLHISETLKSIDRQTFQNFELLIIDDRASSTTLMQVHQFAFRKNNVRIIKNDGVGLVAALNTGIKASITNVIARIDSDDLMVETRIQTQLDFLKANSAISVVGSQMTLINSNGERIGRTKYPENSAQIAKTLNLQNCIGHPSVMFRKDIICEVGGYDVAFEGAEDFELWTRVITRHKIWNLPLALTSYRISDRQFSKSLGDRSLYLSEFIRLKFCYPDEYEAAFKSINFEQRPLLQDLHYSLELLEQEILKTDRLRLFRFQKSLSSLLFHVGRNNGLLNLQALLDLATMLLASPGGFGRLLVYAIQVKFAKFF